MASERRQHQIARRIRERISELLLYEMKDPRASFVTVTDVEMNSDLTVAKVRYTVLGDQTARTKVSSLLGHAHGFLRTEVARALQLRTAPQLVFEYDEGVEHADRIERILRQVLPDDEREQPQPDAG